MLQIEYGDGFIRVSPDVPPCLEEALVYNCRSRVGRRYVNEKKALYQADYYVKADNTVGRYLIAPPGCMWQVTQTLAAAGYQYQVLDVRTSPPRISVEAAMAGLRDYQMGPVQEMLQAGGGIGKFPTGYGKTRMAAALIRAISKEDLWARQTPLCIMAVDSKDINEKNAVELQMAMPDRDVGCVMSGKNKFTDDVMCVSIDSMHRIDQDRVGVLIIDEVHSVGSSSRSTAAITGSPKAIRWGLSATPTGRSDGSDAVTVSVTGPVVSSRSYQDGVDIGALVPITVFLVPAPRPKYWAANWETDNQAATRSGITENVDMYRLLAQLSSRIPPDMQTLFMGPHVENIDRLLEFVPDMPYVHGTMREEQIVEREFTRVGPVSKRERKERYKEMESGFLKRCASTYVYKQGVDFPGLEVVVAFGGGSSEIVHTQVPGRASRSIEGKDRAYLIDFIHPWDSYEEPGQAPGKKRKRHRDGSLRRHDKSRSRLYRKLGFDVIEVESIDEIPFVGVCE
jgi:superfamily II DNA or RNA helicase